MTADGKRLCSLSKRLSVRLGRPGVWATCFMWSPGTVCTDITSDARPGTRVTCLFPLPHPDRWQALEDLAYERISPHLDQWFPR